MLQVSFVRRPLSDRLGLEDVPSPSLAQVVDALILFDTPILDQRFQEAIAMHPDPKVRVALAALPERVAEGSRLTRRAGVEWERVTGGGSILEDEFKRRAERFLMEALLESAEIQIQLKTFLAGHAPTRDVRQLVDDAIAIHRELAQVLRDAIARVGEARHQGIPPTARQTYVGQESERGDLRGQVEQAIQAMIGSGQKPKVLLLSANALRHLRDQGFFQDGRPAVLDVPVRVDFSLPGSSFALVSIDNVALDEIMGLDKGDPHRIP